MFCCMQKCLGWLPCWLRRLLPTIFLVVLAVLAGATDVLGAAVREVVSKSFQEMAAGFMPHVAKILIVAVAANIAWLLYSPICGGMVKILDTTSASDRAKTLTVRVIKLVYWVGITFFVLSFFASDLLGKFLVGFGVLGAALTLSLQGAANDLICGLMLQFSKRIEVGDNISTIGLDAGGKVLDVGYLCTLIEAEDAIISVPNREIWSRAIKEKKPQPKKRLILMPPGVEYPEYPSDKKDEKKGS